MDRIAVVPSDPEMNADDQAGPFGLTREEVRVVWARTHGRPGGLPRYEAFAQELEEAATHKWVDTEFRALALADAYGRLLRRARILRSCLGQALAFIRLRVPGADVRPGLLHAAEFDAEFPVGGDS